MQLDSTKVSNYQVKISVDWRIEGLAAWERPITEGVVGFCRAVFDEEKWSGEITRSGCVHSRLRGPVAFRLGELSDREPATT